MKLTIQEIKLICKKWKNLLTYKGINPFILFDNSLEIFISVDEAYQFGVVNKSNIDSSPCPNCKNPVGFWTKTCNFCNHTKEII